MASKQRNNYQVILTRSALKELSKIPNTYYILIREHLLHLQDDPFPLGAIKLKGSVNEYRLRVGQYRILFVVEHDILTVTVIRIGHRKDVYK